MEKVFGVIASYKTPGTLLKAAKLIRGKGYKNFDVYSPFPIHGMDDAMGLKPSVLGWIVFIGGTCGLLVGLGLQSWAATTAYPLVISGKPLFSYQAFVPVTFELMVLFAAFSAVFGMFVLNKLPQPYHPYFKSENFLKVTSHGFFLGIEANDEVFNLEKVKQDLIDVGGESIEVMNDDL